MEFDPYIPIQPTQGVTSTWSPYGAGALPGVPQPTEDWGKILGNFSASLQKAFAALEPERREEQEAEAVRIVAEQESEELSSLLHEAAKKGDIPAGYSPYLVKQINKQLARKAARELEVWSVDNDGWFNDPDYRATDEEGNVLSAEESTPSAVLERHKEQYLQQNFPGLMGTAEGAQIFMPLYGEIQKKYVEKANDLFTKAQLNKLGAGFSDDVSNVWTMWERDPDATPEQLSQGVRELIKEMREAYSGLNVSLPEGSLNEAAIKPMIKSLETDIAAAEDQEAVGVLEERIEALRSINPKGTDNEKESWGYMFREDLDDLEGKTARRKQALKDRGLTLGDEDMKAGSNLEAEVLGGIFTQVDAWAGQEGKPPASEVDKWVRDYIATNYPGYSPRSVNVALGRIVPKVYDNINDAKEQELSPLAKGSAEYRKEVTEARLNEDRAALEKLALDPPEGEDGSVAVAAVRELERRREQVNTDTARYETKGKTSSSYREFEDLLNRAALKRARDITGEDIGTREMAEDYLFEGFDRFITDQLRSANRDIEALALEYAQRANESADPDAFSIYTAEFNKAVDTYIKNKVAPALERIEAFEIGGDKKPQGARTLTRPQALTEAVFDSADPGWWGMTFDEEGAGLMARNAMAAGKNFYKTLRSDSQYSEMQKAYRVLEPAMRSAATATDAGSSYRGAGVNENKEPTSGMYNSLFTDDISQSEVDARWRVVSAVDAMENFTRPRKLKRLPGSADVVINENTGVRVPEGYLNWEMFPVLGGGMWDDGPGGKYAPTEESKANRAFVDTFQRTFYPEGPEGPKRDSHALTDDEWEEYTAVLEAWQASPSGQVYNTLPDRMQLGEHRFLIEQRRLWKEWAK